jgi:macrolide transport system ATP-binding/permease protein
MKDVKLAKILIRAQSICKDFIVGERRVQGIKSADFVILDGSFTIIHGPSGSGKTTLLNILTGLDKPTTGTVEYQGKNIYELNEAELAHFRARTMGIVYQTSYWVKSLSVLENVALPLYFLGYGKDDAEREARESLRRVGMERYAATLPMLLSGGEQQRVAMARALVSNPNYIVADEPTGNLDSKSGDDIMGLLRYFHESLDRTIILVTHNENYLRYGSSILEVKDGVVSTQALEAAKEKPSQNNGPLFPPEKSLEKLRPIRLSMLLRMAFANLATKRLRSGLTMLGVTVGIGSVFLLLSFGLGLQHLVQTQIIGTDSVRVINVVSTNSEILKLNDGSVNRFAKIAGVDKIGREYTSAATFQLDSALSDAVVYGVDKDFLGLSNLTYEAGNPLDVSEPGQVVISQSLLRSLGYQDVSKAIGKKISLTLKLDNGERKLDRPLSVVGVVKAGDGSAMYVSNNIFRGLDAGDYKLVKVVAQGTNDVATVRRQIEALGYQTSSPLDTLEQVYRFFRFFILILVGFGGVGMFIAVIGMLNTLTITLLERSKEIGLMVALGARRRDVRRLFEIESILLSLIGGIVGVVVSIGLGGMINIALNHLATARGATEHFTLFAWPWWLIGMSIVFMFIVGYTVSYYPVRRAGQIEPIEALRRE